MKKVSNEFINLSKKVKTQDLNLTINDGELTVQEVHFMPVNIFNSIPISRLKARKEVIAKELKYSFEGQLFKTIMQQIEITVKNASEIKGKKVDFKYGILVNNKFEYVDMGEYYIKDVEDNKNKEELVVTGYDKMLNFMIPFKQNDLKLTYPCKMGQLVSRMGEVCGVEVYSTDFYNSDLIVDEDFFTIQELTYRDVLEKVAQATLTTIFIKENKLYLCKIGESVQTLDTSFLSNLVIGEKFGPVNALVLGRGSVEDNIESVDQQSINVNGRCEIRFDENEFIDSKREEVIDGMLQQINGLEYYTIEASNLGILWLDPCDVIIAKDREESEYKTIYLKASVTINTGIEGEMEANIPEETTTEYKVTTKEEKKTLKVERLAKKNEGIIEDVVQQTTENTEKLTQHEQDIDSITDTVSAVEIKANNAQSTANTAKETAENTSNNLETNYYTKTQTNSQIKQESDSIKSSVTKQVATAKQEAIDSANSSTDKKLEDYVETENLGTQIEQNWEHVKVAWNQISEFIQMEILNGNASLAFRKDASNLLMALDKLGQHFYKSGNKEIGTIGLVNKDGKNYLAFSLKAENTNDGMAWGIDIDGEFYPVFELTKFGVEGGAYSGILTMISMLYMSNNPIKLMDSYLMGDLMNSVNFSDTNSLGIIDTSGNTIFAIASDYLKLGELVESYTNNAGVKTIDFKNNMIVAQYLPTFDPEISHVTGYKDDYIALLFKDGSSVYIYKNSSDKRLKKNIKETKSNALNKILKIKHKKFDWKRNNKHVDIGYIAQEMIDIDENFVHVNKIKLPDGTEREDWEINNLSVLATATKAIQEQQEQIEELKEKDKQKDEIIQDLIKRIEKLEGGSHE